MTARLPRAFFARPTLDVALDLLGQRLIRLDGNGRRLSGWIIETEAYIGPEDLGCHAKAGRTARNQVMWGPPGHAYVYFTYGMHWMLNTVTEEDGRPAAVLIRAIVPDEGLSTMQRRRKRKATTGLTDGPAKLCQALGVDSRLNGHDLCGSASRLCIETGTVIDRSDVTTGPRVGLNQVPEPWKSVPWRFRTSGLALQIEEE
jgi:DNA-3-methyladenine glycosylase